MSNEAINEATRRAWRALGFFCDRSDAEKEWRIVGSVKGLRKFASEIRTEIKRGHSAFQAVCGRRREVSAHREELTGTFWFS